MKKRNASIDYLKILSIILIVLFHYFWNGKYDWSAFSSKQRVLVDIFYMFGELGVNCFALISGYYLSASQQPFRVKKLKDLLLQVLFYSVLSAAVIHTQIKPYTISPGTILSVLMPVTTKVWWYTTAYVLLYLFSPYINKCIQNLTQQEYKRFVWILIALFSILPTILGAFISNTEAFLYYTRFGWIFTLYCIAGYIRKNEDTWSIYRKFPSVPKSTFWGAIHIATWVILIGYIVLLEKFPQLLGKHIIMDATYFWRPNTAIMLLLSVSLFMLFRHINVKPNPVSTFLSSATLGIYMTHGGRSGSIWWNRIFHQPKYQGTWMVFAEAFVALAVILATGAIIELVRQGIQKGSIFLVTALSRKEK